MPKSPVYAYECGRKMAQTDVVRPSQFINLLMLGGLAHPHRLHPHCHIANRGRKQNVRVSGQVEPSFASQSTCERFTHAHTYVHTDTALPVPLRPGILAVTALHSHHSMWSEVHTHTPQASTQPNPNIVSPLFYSTPLHSTPAFTMPISMLNEPPPTPS